MSTIQLQVIARLNDPVTAETVEAEKWVQKMHKKSKWHPGKGYFTDHSAEQIANGALRGHDGDVGSAVKSLQGMINQNSNISTELKSKLEHAKKILQAKEKK